MRKILILLFIILVANITNAITIRDDFNRPDNQNVSEGYDGGFVYYEEPLIVLDELTQYNGAEEVFIKNNKLFLEEKDFCDYTTLPIEFDHYGNITNYYNGNISFEIKLLSDGSSNRWIAQLVFGNKLSLTPSYTSFCSGQGNIATWDTKYSKDKTYVFFEIFGSEPNKIFLTGNYGVEEYEISNIGDGEKQKLTFLFDTKRNLTKIIVNEKEQKEFFCNLENVLDINTIVFQLLTNQGNVIPKLEIDNLEVNINKQEEEPETDPLLYEFAPVFVHHPRELFYPKEIESMLSLSDLRTGLKKSLVKEGPLTFFDIEYLADRSLSLDLINVDMYNVFDHPHPDDFEKFEPKVYGKVTKDENDYTYLQYYVFYPFQDFYASDREGDWQLVQVTLNDMDAIEEVQYFFNLGLREVYYDIDYLDFIGNHPIAYVAEGSHNMYGGEGAFFPVLDFFDTEDISFWKELLWGLKSLDNIDKTGINYVPETLNIEGEKYKILQIDDDTGWINYQGRWGERHILPYKSGQRGPKYNSYYDNNWINPGIYTFGIELPFMGVWLYSPLDIIIQDEEGNSLDLEFYTGKDSEPEVAVTLENPPYLLFLNATDKGMFNLSVFFYDGEKGINLKYSEIKNTNTTLAKLEVNEESDFKLCLDYEPDGIFDICYYPDSFILYNGYKYEIPDRDYDGIDDLKDNCPEIYNPLQEDFNKNAKGDICDNPRYYKEKAYELAETEFSKKHIEHSLKELFWESQFEVKTPSVFLMELVSTKKSGENIEEILAEADKLIVEYKLYTIDYNSLSNTKIKKYEIAQKYYQLGVEHSERSEYPEAIKAYLNSWLSLRSI